MPVSFIRQRTAVTYTGPGDIVSGATAWYGLRAYNAAYATGSKNAINVRRASDNTTSNIVILANGNLDIATANTFAGVDATASATATASTTLNLTSASSTPHVGSTITGTGVTQPCYVVSVGSFAGGTGTVVVNAAQTLAAVSISMQYALFVTEAYDQTGNANNMIQATAGTQPQLLPNAGNSLPTMYFNGSNLLATGNFTQTLPLSEAAVASRVANFTTQQFGILTTGGAPFLGWTSTANTLIWGGGSQITLGSVADNAFHAIQATGTSGAATLNADGNSSSGGAIISAISGVPIYIGSRAGGQPLFGYISESGIWAGAFTSPQIGSIRTNQKAYWGTP